MPGAVVVLYDSARRELARAISDARGEYSVARPAATRRMRIVRIGFRPTEAALDAADSIVDARLQPVPALLHDVRASADRVCPDRPNAGVALELWEQARAGLLATRILAIAYAAAAGGRVKAFEDLPGCEAGAVDRMLPMLAAWEAAFAGRPPKEVLFNGWENLPG